MHQEIYYQYHWTVIYVCKKTIFAPSMQNMMISSSLASSPKNVLSIPAFNLKKKFTANTLYMDFDQKIFPQKFLRSHHCRFFNEKCKTCVFLTKTSKILKFENHVISPNFHYQFNLYSHSKWSNLRGFLWGMEGDPIWIYIGGCPNFDPRVPHQEYNLYKLDFCFDTMSC